MDYPIKLYDLSKYDGSVAITSVLEDLLYTELVDRCMLFDETEDEDQDLVGCIENYNRLMRRRYGGAATGHVVPYIVVWTSEYNSRESIMPEILTDMIDRLGQLGERAGIFLA